MTGLLENQNLRFRSILYCLHSYCFSILPAVTPIPQKDPDAIDSANPSATTFRIDFQAAVNVCKEARVCLQNKDLDGCEQLAIQALQHRPACDLAYRILSQLLHTRGQIEDSVTCRQRTLPEWLQRKYFGQDRLLDDADLSTAGIERVTVYESEQYSIDAPAGLFEQAAVPFRRNKISSNGVFIDTVANAMFWHDSSNTLVLDGSGAKLADHSAGNTQLVNALMKSSEPVELQGRVVLLGARGAHNYYHWLLDIVPKLNALQAAGFRITTDDTFVVPHSKPAFARALLAQYGVTPQQIFESESITPFLAAEQLVVPYLSNTMGYSMGSWIPGALQQSMLQHSPVDLQSDLKIYISRDAKTAAGRTVGNQSEVEAYFSQCGFEIVFPERHSVVQQAQLFAKASVVAGPHGAGLSNLVYCAPGTKVFEFFGAHMAPCYWVISALAGLDYHQHYCADDSVVDQQSSAANPRAAGFDISVRSVTKLLQQASVI